MANTVIIADPPRSATGYSARDASVAPDDSGNVTPPAHRPFTTDGACTAKLALRDAGLSTMESLQGFLPSSRGTVLMKTTPGRCNCAK